MAERKATSGQKGPSQSKKKTTKKSDTRKKLNKDKVSDAGNSAKSARSSEANQEHTMIEPVRTVPSQAQVVPAGSGGKVISWLALLLSALALCAGGYAWYLTAVDSKLNVGQQENRFNTIEQRIGGFDISQSDALSQVSQIKNQLTQAEDSFNNQIRTIQTEIADQETAVREKLVDSEQALSVQTDIFRKDFDALSDSIVKLHSELGRSIDSWTLEEAEQLMFVANQRLQFTGDVEISRSALELADERLENLADPGLNSVRQLLSSEILALRNVDSIDTTSVLNKLTTLSDSVGTLPLIGDIVVPEKMAANENQSESESETGAGQSEEVSKFRRYSQPIIDATSAFIGSLGDLIQIEKNGTSIKPVISAEVRQMTYEKTRLTLEAAQIAFIRQQPALYTNRIQSARQWVEQNFDQNANSTITWLAQLNDIGSLSPNAEIPNISASLNAIRDVINGTE